MVRIESNYCEFCYEPLMLSNIVGWTCKNNDCVVNKIHRTEYKYFSNNPKDYKK